MTYTKLGPFTNDVTPPAIDANFVNALETFLNTRVAPVTASPLSGGPPGSPADGDIWIATGVDANGTAWQFRYNAGSGSSFKWEFLGGSKLLAETTGTDTTTSGTPANLTNGPSLTLPRAGDWFVEVDAVASNSVADGQNFLNAGDSSVAANTVITSTFGQAATAGRWDAVHSTGRANGLASGLVLATKAWGTGGGTMSYQTRRITVTPIRIA